MIFPIGDDQVKGGYFPLFSYAFIFINLAVFVYELTIMQSGGIDAFFMTYGAIPTETMRGERLFTLLTSMFIHGSWLHFIGNMLFLWVFADNIEAVIGNFRFLLFYFIGGLAAHFAHIYFNLESTVPTIGASGAISAVMGTYLVMFPTSRVKMLFFVFEFRIPAVLFLGFWIFQQYNQGVASLSILEDSTGVAWWAHIGGFAFGVLAGVYYRLQGLTENALPSKYI